MYSFWFYSLYRY